MSLPKYNEFYEPILKFFADEKVHTRNEVSSFIITYFNLTKEDINAKTENGKRPIFYSRLSWVLHNLVQVKLLNKKERSVYFISNDGLNLIQNNPDNVKESILDILKSKKKSKLIKNTINLNIQNFGAISESKINIAKINVIGGQNATGKSTASKLLYCFLKYNSANRQEFAYESVIKQIRHLVSMMRRRLPINFNEEFGKFHRANFIKFMRNDDVYVILELYEKLKDITLTTVEPPFSEDSPMMNRVVDEYAEIDKLIDIIEEDGDALFNLIMKNLLESEFSNKMKGFVEFNGFFNNEPFNFTSNFTNEYNFDKSGDFIINNVFYIDSFSLLDLNQINGLSNTNHVQSLLNSIERKSDESSDLFDEILNPNIKKVQEDINGIIKGKFRFEDGELKYSDEYGVTCYMSNTASGMKQLGIIQLLLANRKLKGNSFLIIDEPEVNLHPEWQLKLAEILVLLAKNLNIHVYINTHSPLFIEAMSLYSERYGLLNDTNFYLTQKHKLGGFYFRKIMSHELGLVYKNLAEPYDMLDKVKIDILKNRD